MNQLLGYKMKPLVLSAVLSCFLPVGAIAGTLSPFQTLYDRDRVETSDLLIVLAPADEDVRFSITLRDKTTGVERRHETDGEGGNDPNPFLLGHGYYCETPVILLTIRYPWRHALPLRRQLLQTYAFRTADFALIDTVFGPLTDISLLDDRETEEQDEFAPPIGVQCLREPAHLPFRFVPHAPG